MLKCLKGVVTDNQGQGLAEYGLILALVSVASYVALQLLGTNIGLILNNVASDL